MQHFYQNIDGWFTFPELYTKAVDVSPDNSHFVEIGSWLGKSAAYMAVEIFNSNKKIKFDCVDTWEGSIEHQTMSQVINHTLYDNFLENIKPVKEFINPIRLTSLNAANLYEDNSLDFVFLDASHDYDNVKADLLAWYPKVKIGGVFAGHDYPGFEGVKLAVDEFTNNNNINLHTSGIEICWSLLK